MKTHRVYITSVLLFLWAAVSCSPIKRHARLVEKFPYVHTQDSVLIRDTLRIKIPEVRVDTLTTFEQLRDTIVIEKENLKIKLWKINESDTIFVQGACDSVLVEKIVERKIPVRYYSTDRGWLKFLIASIIVLFFLVAIARSIREHNARNNNNAPF